MVVCLSIWFWYYLSVYLMVKDDEKEILYSTKFSFRIVPIEAVDLIQTKSTKRVRLHRTRAIEAGLIWSKARNLGQKFRYGALRYRFFPLTKCKKAKLYSIFFEFFYFLSQLHLQCQTKNWWVKFYKGHSLDRLNGPQWDGAIWISTISFLLIWQKTKLDRPVIIAYRNGNIYIYVYM